jgi:hypothetical protein
MIWSEQISVNHRVHHLAPAGTDDPRARQPERPNDAWAQLWFTLERHHWTTLAVVPADEHTSALAAARELVAAGQRYREGTVALLNGTDTTPETIETVMQTVPELTSIVRQVVIPVDSPIVRPAAIAIARYADAAILAVRLGSLTRVAGQRTIDIIGREQFLGSIAMRGPRG